ncbi:MAG: hypothetical protein HY247_00570 [archaeon]|nr:MAG: hypothetical protein HY247_00570 [archaeon]
MSLEPITQTGEYISLVLVIFAFLTFAILAMKSRSLRSLQGQMFVVVLIIFAAELPRILWTIGIVDLSWLADYGLEVHSVSMVLLTGFLAYRIYGFLRAK